MKFECSDQKYRRFVHNAQVVLNNRQVYHLSKTTIDLDVNTYLTIDPKVSKGGSQTLHIYFAATATGAAMHQAHCR